MRRYGRGVQSDNSLLSVVYRLLDEEGWQRCTVRQQFVECCVQVVRRERFDGRIGG